MLDTLEYPGSLSTQELLTPAHIHHSGAQDSPVNILLAEDAPSDVLLTRIALDESKIPYGLRVLRKGDQILPWLMHELKNGTYMLPDVILLDLGLPRADGFEILAELSHGPLAIRSIPVIILTGYRDFAYMCKDYNLWIPAYLTKPCDPAKLREALKHVMHTRTIGSVRG